MGEDGKATAFVLGSYVTCCAVKVKRFPEPGESLDAMGFVLEPGGKGFNVLVGLHRLGVPVDGMLPIGDDVPGQMAATLIRDAGLSETLLLRVPGTTGGGVGFCDDEGESALAVYRGANARLTADMIKDLATRIANALVVVAQFETNIDVVAHAFGLARKARRTTILNPSPFQSIPSEILALTSVLIVNETEARALAADFGLRVSTTSPQGYDALAERVWASGPDLLIVTRSSEGVVAYPRKGDAWLLRAFSVATVDSLGAGDAFSAGFVSAMIDGLPLSEALGRAAACGALATTTLGVLPALPDRNAVEALLAHQTNRPDRFGGSN